MGTHRRELWILLSVPVHVDRLTEKVATRYIQATTLTVYHGTNAEPFKQFDPKLRGTATDEGELGAGFYFSTDPQVARGRKTLLEAKVSLKRPLVLKLPSWSADKRALVNEALGTSALRGAAVTSELQKQGYDGVVLDYSPVGYHHKEVVALHASQVHIVGNLSAPTSPR